MSDTAKNSKDDDTSGKPDSVPESTTDSPDNLNDDKRQRLTGDSTTNDVSSSGMAGRRIGRYTIIKELGHGGQGYVYLAQDETNQRQVALKILHNMQALNEKTRLRFIREAETASKLTHPGLCAVHEFGEFEGIPFISMQFIEGTPLSDRIATAIDSGTSDETSFIDFCTTLEHEPKTARPDAGHRESSSSTGTGTPADRRAVLAVAKMIEETCRALHAAHEEHLVHRDIKPANIMIDLEGRPVILDFGLARDEEADGATLTQTGDLMGTPAYMSPEQITRSSIRVDRRSDVYSLGVTLFECLTFQRPFSAPTREGLYQSIMFQDAPNPRKLNPAIPDDLRAILEMALEKDPARRYQTAADFADDLRRLRKFEPIRARVAGPWVKTIRWVQRNPMIGALSALLILSMASAAGVFYLKSKEAQDEADQKSIALVAEQNERRKKQEALEAKTLALEEANTERRAKIVALRDYERLADLKRIQTALNEANRLYPPSSELVPKLVAWQGRNEALASRLSDHKAFLMELRKKASPYTEADRKRDYATQYRQLADTRLELKDLELDLAQTTDPKKRDELLQQQKEATELEERLVEFVAVRRSWSFPDEPALQLQHDIMADLVTKLDFFVNDDQGACKLIAKRLQQSREIEAKTLEGPAKAWADCAVRVAANPQYSELKLKPQLGLIPLGPDPQSGLEEFLHWTTHQGDIPVRQADGKIAFTQDVGLILVLIPGGEFSMGCQSANPKAPNYDPEAVPDEGPVHKITLDAFFLSKFEMNQGQWFRSFATNPSHYTPALRHQALKKAITDVHPVENISWLEADKLLPRLGLVLPTEAEWELAARGGVQQGVLAGNITVSQLPLYANICGSETLSVGFSTQEPGHKDEYCLHAPVGTYLPNDYGLHDMMGNVTELCADGFFFYSSRVRNRGLRGDPITSPTRMHRGGSFLDNANRVRVTYREFNTPEYRNNYLGIRPARVLDR